MCFAPSGLTKRDTQVYTGSCNCPRPELHFGWGDPNLPSWPLCGPDLWAMKDFLLLLLWMTVYDMSHTLWCVDNREWCRIYRCMVEWLGVVVFRYLIPLSSQPQTSLCIDDNHLFHRVWRWVGRGSFHVASWVNSENNLLRLLFYVWLDRTTSYVAESSIEFVS
jgi:hypothetical protein